MTSTLPKAGLLAQRGQLLAARRPPPCPPRSSIWQLRRLNCVSGAGSSEPAGPSRPGLGPRRLPPPQVAAASARPPARPKGASRAARALRALGPAAPRPSGRACPGGRAAAPSPRAGRLARAGQPGCRQGCRRPCRGDLRVASPKFRPGRAPRKRAGGGWGRGRRA